VLVLAVFSTWYLAVPAVAAAASVFLHRQRRSGLQPARTS
jgi:hypothetical protein